MPWTFGAGGDYSERLDWLTDVMSPPSGGGQHRRLRQSPRVTLTMATLQSGHARRVLEARLRENAGRRWFAPVAVDACVLAAAAAIDDTELLLDTTGSRFIAGGYALLQVPDALDYEVVPIAADGVEADRLLLPPGEGLAAAWPAGTLVTPLRAGRMTEFPSIGRFTSDESNAVEVSFVLIEPLEDTASLDAVMYRSYPVWPFRPVWTSDPVLVPERVLQVVDYGIAAPVVHDIADVPQARVTMQFAAKNRDDIVSFRQALYALAGRWSPVWVPSWVHDVHIVANVANGSTTVDIEGPLLAGLDLAANQRDLRIALANGTVLHRRITAIATPAAGVERLTLDSAIATGFAATSVDMACFLILCAQDADTNLLRYWTRDVMECELSWRQLAHGL